MKKKLRLLLLFLLPLLMIVIQTGVGRGVGKVYAAQEIDEFKGVWVSTIINLDFPSKPGLSDNQIRAEIIDILDRTVQIGLNAVVLQVRPAGDALYDSAIYPWSQSLTGVQGQAPGFDPLECWVAEAHARGLELHAWINPYRVSHSSHKRTDVSMLSADNPARLNPSWAVAYKDGGIYFDPGIPDVRRLVIDGVKEIVENYDVDGIHLDDYFYPGADFPDDGTYSQYGAGMSKDDWRRYNTDALVSELSAMLKQSAPGVRFGISPFAIWQNLSTTPLGSDTNGMEAYSTYYCDSRKWVKEGWLDYVCPQIYWYIGYPIADYQTVLDWWIDVCTGTGVDLYVGHAAYKEAEGTAEWNGETVSQLRLNARGGVAGSIFFRYAFLKGRVGDQIRNFYAGVADIADQHVAAETPIHNESFPRQNLALSQPLKDASTNGAGYYLMGTCNPEHTLYLNGEPVELVTSEGFFGAYVLLEVGANEIVIEQEGEASLRRVITRNATTTSAPPEIVVNPKITEAYPKSEQLRREGWNIALSCRAPKGAEVMARIGDFSMRMNETGNTFADGTIMYTYDYTLPERQESGVIIDIGRPRYTMTYNGSYYQADAEGLIKCITNDTTYYAKITAESAWMYPVPTTDVGSEWLAVYGQLDEIAGMSGDWVLLRSGLWIQKSNVSCIFLDEYLHNNLYDAEYSNYPDSEVLRLRTDLVPMARTDYNGSELRVMFALSTELPELMLPGDSVFKSVDICFVNGLPAYTFVLKDGERVEGYFISIDDEGIRLTVRKHRRASAGERPLEGFKFVIDAGHGYDDSGAVGPMGKAIAEKDINLINAMKLSERLRSMGAEIVMIRKTDVFYSLTERAQISLKEKPDLFISIHANALAEITDATKVQGVTVWYRNENSRQFADSLLDGIYLSNPMTNRLNQTEQANFFVCRPTWTPSVIIEASFMGNPRDFSWLINESCQDAFADDIAASIVRYYSE